MNVVNSDEDDDNEEADTNYERSSPRLLAVSSRHSHTDRTAVHSLQTARSTSDPVSTNYIKGKHFPWSAEHLRLLRKGFGHFKKPPDNASIKKFMEQEPSLKNRTIPQIKSRAWALICSKKARLQ